MAVYQIPREINSPTELIKGIHFEQFAFVVLYFLVFYLFQGLVHEMLVLPYYIFNIVIGFVLIGLSTSPKRSNLQSIIYQLNKSRNEKIYYGKPDTKQPISYN